MNLIVHFKPNAIDEDMLFHTLGKTKYDGCEFTLSASDIESKRLYWYDLSQMEIKRAVSFLKGMPVQYKNTGKGNHSFD